MLWFKAPGRARIYPAAWPGGILVDLVGSKYEAPSRHGGGVVLPGLGANDADGNAELVLNGDGIAPPGFYQALSIDSQNHASTVAPALPHFQLRFTAKTGLFKGAFGRAGAKKADKFAGAVLQKQQRGGGFFLGNVESGTVALHPDDAPGGP
jgi:hypothetical protein